MRCEALGLIKKCKSYIFKKEKKINLYNPIIYFCSYSKSISYYKLKLLHQKKFLLRLLYIKHRIKSFLLALKYNSIKTKSGKLNDIYDECFITFGKFSDFKDKRFIDRFFSNIQSRKNHLKIIIYLSDKFPSKVPNDVIIFKQDTSYSITNIINIILNLKHNFLNFFSYEYMLSKNISDEFEQLIKKKCKIKNLKILYESQLFHLKLIDVAKKNKINCYGYVHSVIPPLPTNYIYKEPAPQKLFVSGFDTTRIFTEILGWPKSVIKRDKTIRFKKLDKLDYLNKIYTPIELINPQEMLKNIKKFFDKTQFNSKRLSIKLHPSLKKNQKTRAFLRELESIINMYSKNLFIKDFSLFLGSTSSVIECLENNIDVYHLVSDQLFEGYNNKIFSNIKVFKICENIFNYKLDRKRSYIDY